MKSFARNTKNILFLVITTVFLVTFFGDDSFARICDGGQDCVGGNQISCEAVSGCTWVVNENLADETAFVQTICNLVSGATGGAGKVLASIAILAVGIGFFTGKVSWGLMLGVGAGIASMFGSLTIVSAISGTNVFNCVVSMGTSCDTSSPGYSFPPDSEPSSSTSAGHNGSIRIQCKDGYYGIVNNLVCFDQEWYGGSGMCEQTDCGNPNNLAPLDNGTWDVSQANDGDTITGECHNGYRGSATVECSLSQYINLSGGCQELPSCDPSTSGYQQFNTFSSGQPFGTWSQTTVYVDQSISATCNTSESGIAGTAPTQLRCVFNADETAGVWEGAHDGDCVVFDNCTADNLPAEANLGDTGSWPNGGNANHGDQLDGICNEGYTTGGAPEIFCDNGSYSGFNDVKCPKGCETSSPGYRTISFEGTWGGNWVDSKIPFGEKLIGNCPGGSIQTPELECSNDTDGNPTWTSDNQDCLEKCTESTDGYIDLSAGGTWQGAVPAKFQEKLTGNCPGGSDGTPELICEQGLMGSEWISAGPDCYRGCDTNSASFRALTNGGTWQSSGAAGHTLSITGSCPGGHDVTPSLTCNDGTWESDSGGECYKECTNANGALALATGSSWPKQTGPYDDLITAGCEYSSTNPPKLRCNDQGQWIQEGNGECTIGCDTSSPGYQAVTGGSWSGSGRTGSGSQITFSCSGGKVLVGTVGPLTCNSGTYTGTVSGICGDPGKCYSNSPGFISSPPTNASWPTNTTVSSGGSITATCGTGFTASGSTRLACSNGSWSTSSSSLSCNAGCTSSSAGFTSPPTNASWPTATTVSHNANITATCGAEFTPSGSSKLTCNNGSWTNTSSSLVCYSGCSNPSLATAFAITGIGTWSSTSTGHNQTISANCTHGPSSGGPSVTCNNGTFSWQSNTSCYQQCDPNSPNVDTAFALSSGGTWNKATKNHGQTITPDCPSGAYTGSEPKLTCNGATGTFTKSGGDCTILCTRNSPGYMPIHGRWSNSETAGTGESVTALCTNTSGSTPSPMTCTDSGGNGVWTGGSGDCPVVKCPWVPQPGNYGSDSHKYGKGWGTNSTTISPKGGQGWRCVQGFFSGYINACRWDGVWADSRSRGYSINYSGHCGGVVKAWGHE